VHRPAVAPLADQPAGPARALGQQVAQAAPVPDRVQVSRSAAASPKAGAGPPQGERSMPRSPHSIAQATSPRPRWSRCRAVAEGGRRAGPRSGRRRRRASRARRASRTPGGSRSPGRRRSSRSGARSRRCSGAGVAVGAVLQQEGLAGDGGGAGEGTGLEVARRQGAHPVEEGDVGGRAQLAVLGRLRPQALLSERPRRLRQPLGVGDGQQRSPRTATAFSFLEPITAPVPVRPARRPSLATAA
jgi:hypothetical protein